MNLSRTYNPPRFQGITNQLEAFVVRRRRASRQRSPSLCAAPDFNIWAPLRHLRRN